MMDAWLQALAIATATLVSEDLTCLTVGLLVIDGQVSPGLGVLACALGIYAGDLGLWLVGRIGGRRVLDSRWVASRISATSVADLAGAFDRRAGRLIVASRFLPGTRLPLYLAAGAIGRRGAAFALWTLVSVVVWVPLVVLTVAAFGEVLVRPLQAWFGASGAIALVVFAAWAVFRMLRGVPGGVGLARLAAAVSRLWRWEFWPMWAFYPPVAVWVAGLALRHGGISTLSAANPGMPEGGFVGESKSDILASLPRRWTLPAVRVDPGTAAARAAWLEAALHERAWSWPIVLKPDVGERGVAVRLAASGADARAYFDRVPGAVVAQVYHPGPHEAGIFYYRFPHEMRGRIFSITDKRFPDVVGDGRSTLEALIWRHARYRMQARRFLERLGAKRGVVPAAGERVRLAVAGNHAQGTEFRDGSHLVTPALEARIDEIARAIPGFHIGRFDVRYGDVERFAAGEDLAIVELNGATSESTNIYDPSRSLLSAYRTLFRQWSLVFRIGAANRRLGYRPAATRRLVSLAIWYVRQRSPLPVSD